MFFRFFHSKFSFHGFFHATTFSGLEDNSLNSSMIYIFHFTKIFPFTYNVSVHFTSRISSSSTTQIRGAETYKPDENLIGTESKTIRIYDRKYVRTMNNEMKRKNKRRKKNKPRRRKTKLEMLQILPTQQI